MAYPLQVEIPLVVKTYDIDFAGVVSNIVYVRWLEDLRLEILERYFPLQRLLDLQMAPAIAQTKIDYKQSLRLSDRPIGKMWVAKMESSRLAVEAEISTDGKIAATAEQVCVFVNLSSGRPTRIPADLKQKYQEFLAELETPKI